MDEIHVMVFVRFEDEEYEYYINRLANQGVYHILWIKNLSAIMVTTKDEYLFIKRNIHQALSLFTEIQLIKPKR